jgi:predicted amidophosphoribosyltransferase
VLHVLAPTRCALCRAAGPGLCASCGAALPPAPATGPPPDLDACWALLAYAEPVPQLVAALKYRNHRDALAVVARALAVFVARSPTAVDAITWAPTSRARRRARGYDQAELLARAVARRAHLPALGVLRRRPGPPQTGADRAQRLRGPSFEPAGPVPGHVVVVDDVCTTGSTLGAAARALRRGGATRVSGLVLAVNE